MLLLVSVLGEEEQTLASLAGPGDDRVGNFRLFATEVLPQVGRVDGLVAEPEVLLGEAECAASSISMPCRAETANFSLSALTSSVQGPCSQEHRCRWARRSSPRRLTRP